MKYYTLDKDKQVVETTEEAWSQMFEGTNRIVARTEITPTCDVSTVFIGINHRHGGKGPPLTFETMVFQDESGKDCWRYSTWDDAVIGHEAVVRKMRWIFKQEIKPL